MVVCSYIVHCTPLCRLCGRLDDLISGPTRAVGATVTEGTVTLIGLPSGQVEYADGCTMYICTYVIHCRAVVVFKGEQLVERSPSYVTRNYPGGYWVGGEERGTVSEFQTRCFPCSIHVNSK